MAANIEWQPQDAARFREFLASESGSKFMAFVQASNKIDEAASIEEEALNFRAFKRGMVIINTINLLSQEPQPKPDNVVQFHNTADTSGSGRSSTKA